ncbi:MAG: extracellular solute-binding protein, partial [Limnochordia bacterium]|nr:extracellular solute-binding protein [Limnochordia bacterium]
MRCKNWLRCLMVVSLLLSILVPVYATADSEDLERITLEVVLTGGRDPNVNVVQDYGDIVWTEVLTQEFQKEYPNVDVVFRTGTLEQTIVSMIGGVGPDIVNGYGPQFINMGRQGMFIDLLPLLERDGAYEEVKLSYWPPQFGVFQHQGRVFALPQYLNIFAMYYNADMFGYMGVPDPEPRADLNTMDWREFETIARKLTQDRDGDGTPDIWGFSKVLTVTDHLHYWLKAAGSDFYGNEEKTVSILDNPAAVEALEYLQHLRWEAEVMPPPGSPWPWDAWKQGNVAIQEYGSHALVDYLGLQKDG